MRIQDDNPLCKNPESDKAGGLQLKDYLPTNIRPAHNKGIDINPLPNHSIGLLIGFKVETGIQGNKIEDLSDLRAYKVK
ncbi:hypothetical protein DDZ16_05060 [Marinilabilia rubra]|uniref:Uncharacterized protein n=1 Tax=Marinilabilia rubra TaxID=2162893 RepID=A0A2U2BB75_9BACT|nr:hypothetical protein DDZ16_05060 [Marinilabilia rubra]